MSTQRPVDITDAARILREHNVWRRWNGDDEDGPQGHDSGEIGRAIDMAIAYIEAGELKRAEVSA